MLLQQGIESSSIYLEGEPSELRKVLSEDNSQYHGSKNFYGFLKLSSNTAKIVLLIRIAIFGTNTASIANQSSGVFLFVGILQSTRITPFFSIVNGFVKCEQGFFICLNMTTKLIPIVISLK